MNDETAPPTIKVGGRLVERTAAYDYIRFRRTSLRILGRRAVLCLRDQLSVAHSANDNLDGLAAVHILADFNVCVRAFSWWLPGVHS